MRDVFTRSSKYSTIRKTCFVVETTVELSDVVGKMPCGCKPGVETASRLRLQSPPDKVVSG